MGANPGNAHTLPGHDMGLAMTHRPLKRKTPRWIGCRYVNTNDKPCLQRERSVIHKPCPGKTCQTKRGLKGIPHAHHTFTTPRPRDAATRLRTTIFLSVHDREFLVSWGGSISIGAHRMILIVRALEEASERGQVAKVERPAVGGQLFEEPDYGTEELVT